MSKSFQISIRNELILQKYELFKVTLSEKLNIKMS